MFKTRNIYETEWIYYYCSLHVCSYGMDKLFTSNGKGVDTFKW